MKTNYQKVLSLFSASSKDRYTISEMMSIFQTFLDEVREAIDSGIEVKQVAALEKLRNIRDVCDELTTEKIVIADEKEMSPEQQGTFLELKADLQTKLDKVCESYEKMIQNG